MRCVEVEIKFEDTDAGLTEESKLAAEGMFGDQRADVVFGHVPLTGYAGNLEIRGGWGYFGVEAGSRTGDEVHGDCGGGIFRVQFGYVTFDAID